MDDYSDLIKNIFICIILILAGLFCLYILNIFHIRNYNYQNNEIASRFVKYIYASSDQQMTLNK